MPRFVVEVERTVIEVVEFHIDADTAGRAQDEAIELARADDGEIIHREVEGDVITITRDDEE